MSGKNNSKSDLSNIAIIGSGPTALYLLKYIWEDIEALKNEIQKISIFEREEILGMGMPYNPKTTDVYNLANISSEEIPMIQESFGDWLRRQNPEILKQLNISNLPIDDSEVYSRVALGHYFEEQFNLLISCLESKNIQIIKYFGKEVIDISQGKEGEVIITDNHQKKHEFSTVIVANGHEWKGEDHIEAGYFASPWPIHKLIPKNNETYNFAIGTLGASLSAFDVVTSLSHRHGVFETINGKLIFKKNDANPDFKIILHSAEGWLPHLQYEQQKPIREIYRHFHREQLLELIDEDGFMKIEDYFDNLCRPALVAAFTRDKLEDVVTELQQSSFSFKDLVKLMSQKHKYVNSFEGMKSEMEIAKNSVYNKIPIYWMETLDDLMYSLNYHAELLAAEDHHFFHKEIMSFLMNVIAALPLQSAKILLALYDANSIELKSGRVNFPVDAFKKDRTTITVDLPHGGQEILNYKLFINCGGGKKLKFVDYPFKSLVRQNIVSAATASFREEKLNSQPNNSPNLELSGIAIDASYRTINKNGEPNNFLYDINFNHTNGLRPYSYGLQACSATSLILVESWIAAILEDKNVGKTIENITELYEDIEGL